MAESVPAGAVPSLHKPLRDTLVFAEATSRFPVTK